MSTPLTSLTTTHNPTEYPYEGEAFRHCWWEHLAAKFDIARRHQDFVIVEKKMLKGLVSLKELRIAGWNNAWSQDLTPERVETLAEFYKKDAWDYFRFHWAWDREGRQAFEQLKALGLKPVHVADSPEYIIDLSGGYDDYLQSKSKDSRKDIRRKLKAAANRGPEFRVFDGEAGVDEFFELFFRFHLPYWDTKTGESYFHDPRERAFAVAWAQALQNTGHLLLEGFYLHGELTNLTMSIRTGTTLYSVLTINTGAEADFFPGLVSLHLRMQQAPEKGISTWNLGRGDYVYKVQTANRQNPMHQVVVANPRSIRGKIYADRLTRKLKTLADQTAPETIAATAIQTTF